MKHLAAWLLLILMAFCALPELVSAQQGLPVDGKDFYLGYIYPSINKNPNNSSGRNVSGFFNVYALISSYEEKFHAKPSNPTAPQLHCSQPSNFSILKARTEGASFRYPEDHDFGRKFLPESCFRSFAVSYFRLCDASSANIRWRAFCAA